MKGMKERIFVTHVLPGKGLEELKKKYEVEVWPKRDIGREDLLKKVKGVVGIVSLVTEKIDKEVMDTAGDSLKIIANYAVGFDNIDVEEANKRGIVVTNTPGIRGLNLRHTFKAPLRPASSLSKQTIILEGARLTR